MYSGKSALKAVDCSINQHCIEQDSCQTVSLGVSLRARVFLFLSSVSEKRLCCPFCAFNYSLYFLRISAVCMSCGQDAIIARTYWSRIFGTCCRTNLDQAK